MVVSPINSLAEFKKKGRRLEKWMREKRIRQRHVNEILYGSEVESETEDFSVEAFQEDRRSHGATGGKGQEQTHSGKILRRRLSTVGKNSNPKESARPRSTRTCATHATSRQTSNGTATSQTDRHAKPGSMTRSAIIAADVTRTIPHRLLFTEISDQGSWVRKTKPETIQRL